MARLAAPAAIDFRQALLETYAVNDRMKQILIERLDPGAWRAKPPGGNGRTIAAIFAHVHNIRRKWLRLSAPHLKLPAALDRARCTQKQARAALAESAARCSEMLAQALAGPGGRVRNFLRDGWAKPWPVGAPWSPTWFHTTPIIADRCACWRISSDCHCRPKPPPGSGIGKGCGGSVGSSTRSEVGFKSEMRV